MCILYDYVDYLFFYRTIHSSFIISCISTLSSLSLSLSSPLLSSCSIIMELFSVIRLFSHVTVLATLIVGGLINVSPTHAVKNVKISQSEADDVATANNERHLSILGDSPPVSDSYSYERGYLVVVNEDDSVLVGANGGDLFPVSEYGGAVVACDCTSAVSTRGAFDAITRVSAGGLNAKTNSKLEERVGLSPGTPSCLEVKLNYDAVTCGDVPVRLLGQASPDGPSPSSLDGSSVFQSGLVYDPTELKIRNKPDGVTEEEIWNTSWVQQHTCNAPMVMDSALGRKFAGGRQPVQPIPPGDKSYFFHSECVATSVIEDIKGTSPYNYGDTSLVTSHSCTLNLCLGGGGFDCIAIFAGGGYVFNLSPNGPDGGPIELAPPFRGTILGGTGSFEGIEGTVDVVTITGSTGPIPLVESPSYDSYMYRAWNVARRICILAITDLQTRSRGVARVGKQMRELGHLQYLHGAQINNEPVQLGFVSFGKTVLKIVVKSNIPLPVAP